MPGYKITNMVGTTQTRVHRWNSPTTHRSKQMVAHHRLLPKQSAMMSEAHYKTHEGAILAKVRNGELMVTCPDGTTITSAPNGDLIYRKPSGEVSVPVAAPAPVVEAPKAYVPEPVVEVKVEEPAPIEVDVPAAPEEKSEEKADEDNTWSRKKKGKR